MIRQKQRCSWAVNDPLLIEYHDTEWGEPLDNDNELFERLTLEVFQAGLSWRLILHKRAALNEAFSNFFIERVASFTERDIKRLLNDERIIRNRKKIEATIENARRLREIIKEHGSFAAYIDSLPRTRNEVFRELKKRFCFMGPKVAESFLQSIGKLDGVHEPGCYKMGIDR